VTCKKDEDEAPCLQWRLEADGWEPFLTTGCPDREELIQRLQEGAKAVSKSSAWKWSKKINDPEKFRQKARTSIEDQDHDALDAFAAQASDIIQRNDVLESTMFDLTSGNQRFLKSITDISSLPDDDFREALFGPWTYSDTTHSLGWDPQAQRLHALRHKMPEKDKAKRSVRAAVFLASQALPLFPCFAVGGKLRTTGFHRDDGDDWFTWPIWEEPISLVTLRSLLAHPVNKDLRRRGVELMYRCRRVRTGGSEGNYQVFSNAEERPWS